jgi:hypothetical protein
MHYEALNALPSEHPTVCKLSTNLAGVLMNAHSNTRQSEYLDRAMAAFWLAATCETASPSLRFHAAKLWASHADSNHKSALDVYAAAIELLPCLAMLGLDLQSRQQALVGSNGLACDAAACAIRSSQYDRAVELLEEGSENISFICWVPFIHLGR